MIPSEADVAAFLSAGCVLRGEFRWKSQGRSRWKGEAYLEDTYDGARVKLVGTFNERTRNLSYTLVWAGCRIRSLDVGGPAHENPDGIAIETPHKHKWSQAERDRWVYRPHDITATNLSGIFEQFLAECGILFQGTFLSPEDQGELL